MLTFANPLFLWGLLFLSIPIIIHLFNFRRVKKIEFSNIALLKRVKEESSSKRKPVELLILLSRLFFISFLIFAFAQPVLKDKDSEQNLSKEALVYFDNSFSMEMPANSQQSAFDIGFSFANGVVDAYPETSKFRFLENGYGNSLNTTYTASTIKDRFTELSLSGVGRSISEIQSRVESNGFRGDVYLISDFQKLDGRGLESLSNDSLRNYYLLPVSQDASSNLYFDTAYLENSFLLGALKNDLKVVVKNEGTEDFEDVNIRLFFNEQLASTTLVNVPANGIIEHSFEIDRNANGLNHVKLSLEDSKVTFDNDFFLTLNNLEKVVVNEIREIASNNFINRLYENNELFNYQSFDVNNFDVNQLIQGDIIIINEVSSYSNQLISAIRTFLDNRGTVLVIPSGRNGQTFSQLGMSVRPDSDERLELAQPDFQNPFFNGVFEDMNETIGMPEGSNTFRLMNSEVALLSFKNGREFLSKVDLPVGNLYFFSSNFSTTATSFPNHSLFVPVMYKLALGSNVNLSRLYYLTDEQTINYPLESSLSTNDIVNLVANEERIIPDQRLMGKNLIMEIPKDELMAGHFTIKDGDQSLGVISFNQSKSESSMERFTEEELELISEAANVFLINADDGLEVDRVLTAGVKGVSLWKYALALALVFLFAEIILIRYL